RPCSSLCFCALRLLWEPIELIVSISDTNQFYPCKCTCRQPVWRASEMTGVLYDSRWVGNHGMGRFAAEVQRRLTYLVPFRAQRQPSPPLDPALLGATLRGLD